jgi:hypothetical protein
MNAHKVDSKIIGLLFILPILFYGIGNSLIQPILTIGPSSQISFNIKIGGLLMILNSITVTVIGILLFPLLKKYQKRVATIYLVARIFEALLLLVGIIGIFSTIPLVQHFGKSELNPIEFQNFRTFAFGINYYSYQISMLILGLGSIPFCYLMYKQQLIPNYLSLWGCLGYGLLLTGSICEFLGFNIGIALSIPGGVFELWLGFWLLIRGFPSPN